MGFAIAAHALVLIALLAVATVHRQEFLLKPVALVEVTAPPVTLPVAPNVRHAGGGGGQHDDGPAAQGRLPRFAKEQIVPLKAPPMEAPRLAAEPAIDVQKDLKMATNSLPNFGLPNSTSRGVSLGNGTGAGCRRNCGTIKVVPLCCRMAVYEAGKPWLEPNTTPGKLSGMPVEPGAG